MKKIISFAIFILLFSSYSFSKEMFVEYNVAPGLSIPGGYIKGIGDDKNPEVLFGISTGFVYGYHFFTKTIKLFACGALDYAHQPIKVKRVFASNPLTDEFTFSFININAGIRLVYKLLYVDAYLTYGFHIGDIKNINILNNIETTLSIPNNFLHNEFGIILRIGALYKIKSYLSINCSLSYKTSFLSVYNDSSDSNSDSLTTHLLTLYLGVAYHFNAKPSEKDKPKKDPLLDDPLFKDL